MASDKIKKEILETDSEKEFRLQRYPDVSVITENKINCTVCFNDIKHVILLKEKVYEHILLNVVLCKRCYDFYGNGNFSTDEDGLEKYCGWCGEGGHLYVCSKCPHAFCKKCLKGNLGRKYITNLELNDWRCLFCKPKPLYELRALCWAVNKYLKNKKSKPEVKAAKPSGGRKSILDLKAFKADKDYSDELEQAKNKYQQYLTKLRSIVSSFEHYCKEIDIKSLKTLKEFKDLSVAIDINLNTSIVDLTKIQTNSSNFLKQFQKQLVKKGNKVNEVIVISDQESDKPHSSLTNISPSSVNISVNKDNLTEMDTINEILIDNNETQIENDVLDTKINVRPDLFNSINEDSINDVFNNTLSETVENTITKENGNSKKHDKIINSSEDELFNSELPIQTNDSRILESPSSDPLGLSDDSKKSKKDKKMKKTSDIENKNNSEKTSDAATRKKKSKSLDSSSSDPLGLSDDAEKRKKDKKMKKTSDIENKNNSEKTSDAATHIKKSKSLDSSSSDSLGLSDDAKKRKRDKKMKKTSDMQNENNSEKTSDAATSKMKSKSLLDSSSSDLCVSSDDANKSKKDKKMKKTSDIENENNSEKTSDAATSKKKSKSLLDSSSSDLCVSSDDANKSKTDKKMKKTPDIENENNSEKTSDAATSKKKSKSLLDSSSTDPLDSSDNENEGKKIKREKKLKKKSEMKKDKNDEINLSSSDDEFNKLLSSNPSYKKKRRENRSGSSSSESHKENVKKKKTAEKENELSLVDCLYDNSMDGSFNNSDVNNLDIDFTPVFEFERNDDARLNYCLLSDSDKSITESYNDICLILSEDEKEKNEKDKKAKEARNKDELLEGKKSEETDSNKKDRKKSFRKDNLLSLKLTDEDTSEEERKWANKDLKTKIKSSTGSSSDEEPTIPKKKVVKRKAGKKLFSNSEDSSGSIFESESEPSSDHSEPEEDEESDSNKKNKKRKRIQTLDSGSDSSGGPKKKKELTDSEKKGRKNIRKLLDEDNLKASTQAALKEEQERKKRIAEKQKIYNQMMEIAANATKELKEVVLDFDAETKTPILMVDSELVKKLKPHQAQGIKFMWDSCFESLKDTKNKKGSGCILAHCMGLGKTLQVITLLHTLLTNKQCNVNTALIVAPVSTVLNWVSEFHKWLKDIGSGQDVEVFHLNRSDAAYRSHQLKEWHRCGGVMIMGYNLFRSLVNPPGRTKKAFKTAYSQTLLDPGPDIVICDEGHILKNESTAISKAMTRIKTLRRIVLTGTPLQNNLVEYHCMVQFVKPSLLGTKKEFKNRFVNPIQNGQFEDSTSRDVKIMQRRAHVLHAMLDGVVQRKDYNVLTPYLPPKYEYVLHLRPSDLQCKLYRFYLDNVIQTNDLLKKRLFSDFQNLMRICLHPRALLLKSEKDDAKELKTDEDEEGSLKDFIDDDGDDTDSTKSSLSDSSSKSGSSSHSAKPVARRYTRRTKPEDIEEQIEEIEERKEWWSDMVSKEALDDIAQSPKMLLFFKILKYCEEIGDKLLIFSQSLYTLDIIEYFLDKIDSGSLDGEFTGRWIKGADYYRLDGSTPSELRIKWCKSFNKETSTRARLFLISTRAGGLGINLTGANRVILFDASWNPSYDVQSIFRVFRFGQSKPCYIYRFLSKGTMEEKIYERQVAKLSTALRVIDEHQIDRHFSHSALAELYTFDPEGSELQGTPILPKDRVMAELFQNHKDIILSYHQHDSLLENKEDQELTEDERKAAWDEYENEKNPPPMMSGMGIGMGQYNMFSDPVQQKTYSQLLVINDIEMKIKRQIPNMTKEEMDERIFAILMSFPDYHMTREQFMILRSQLLTVQSMSASSFQNTGTMLPPTTIRGAHMPSTSYQTPNLNFANAQNFRGGTSMIRNPSIRNANPPFGQMNTMNTQKGVNQMNIQNSAANIRF